MAATSSHQRAQLLREMNRTRHSSEFSRHPQSPQPTVSDFDPENEAMMSTRQLDNNARKLPELRASAQRYQKPRFPEPEYMIDTSALGQAFPDFSQGESTDNSDISIEIGRGVKGNSILGKLPRLHEFSSNADLDAEDESLTYKAPLMDNHRVMYTPSSNQLAQQPTDARRSENDSKSQLRRTSGLRNEIETSPPAKTKDYGSSESRKSSEGSRHTLSAMHARVRDEKDMSQIIEERPLTQELTYRSTRFNSNRPVQSAMDAGLPTRFSVSNGLHSGKAPKNHIKNQVATPQGTQQSFVLPEMPNMSELVSGIFEDGTPVFSRHGKSRMARAPPSQSKLYHVELDELPVPHDEQKIFVSIKLLQDKVSMLEREKAEIEVNRQELEHKNLRLEAEKSQRRGPAYRNDSALGTTDSEDVDERPEGRYRGRVIQKNRYESSIRTLQTQIDASNRRALTAETIVHNITEERDSAVSQLGVAYVTIEQLKSENESFKSENQDLKDRIQRLTSDHESHTKQWTAKATAMKEKLAKRSEAITALQKQPGKATLRSEGRSMKKARAQTHQSDATEASGYDELFDLTPMPQDVRKDASREQVAIKLPRRREQSADQIDTNTIRASGNTGRTDPGPVVGDTSEASRDFTYLSFIDTKDIAKLRKTIELEHLEQQQRRCARNGECVKESVQFQSRLDEPQVGTNNILPRRSSMKSMIEKANENPKENQAPHGDSNEPEHRRRHSEGSILSNTSRRRGPSAQNMTSAFILPDITIRSSISKHDGNAPKNPGFEKQGLHHQDITVIPKPVPVSERIPGTVPGEEDPTIRPFQTPGLALATVIKNIEDEISQLKSQLSSYQRLYNSHNPALSKRKRKYVFEKIESVLQAIDAKSDQIYSLYDVLEGQKQSGQELTRQEVEITLQSVGVDLSEVDLRGGEGDQLVDKQPTSRHAWDLSSDDSTDDDLPWEGIESTIGTIKSASTHGYNRKSFKH